MDYHIVEARYVAGHVVWLRFRDGTSGEINLAPALRGPVFEPLGDPEVFRRFQVHPGQRKAHGQESTVRGYPLKPKSPISTTEQNLNLVLI
jgi:hypothetical protein